MSDNYKNEIINIEYIKSDSYNGIYTSNSKYVESGNLIIDRLVKRVEVRMMPDIQSISKINSTFSSYDAYLQNQLIWTNEHLYKISKEIHKKIIDLLPEKKIVESSPNADELDQDQSLNERFTCEFSIKEWDDLRLWRPKLIYKNIEFENVSSADSKIIWTYASDYKLLAIRTIDHKNGSFKGSFNFKTFPFDKQDIYFNFVIRDSTNNVFPRVSNLVLDSNMDLFISDWSINDTINYKYLHDTDILNFSNTHLLSISLSIERNFQYYMLKIFLPILIILIVSWSCFWVSPKELEARLTVSIVCLLSLIAYTFVIDQELPKLSYFTIMDYAVLLSYVFSTIPTFASIYVKRIASKNLNHALKIDSWLQIATPAIYLSILIFIFYIFTANNSGNLVQAFS